jgi:hypothetical protein
MHVVRCCTFPTRYQASVDRVSRHGVAYVVTLVDVAAQRVPHGHHGAHQAHFFQCLECYRRNAQGFAGLTYWE